MENKTLSKKEELFCEYMRNHFSPREAAAFAGYIMPTKSAQKLMADKRIKSRLKKQKNKSIPTLFEISDGLRRIAFGSCADAIKLINSQEKEPINPETLDLMNVQEIKQGKNGGMEIKFFDRIKALECLSVISEHATDGTDNSFFKAIMASVKKEEDFKT